MGTTRAWTYYQYDTVAGPPLTYFRRWRGVTDRIDRQTKAWVSVDPLYLSRYIELGEVGLDETTRAEIETTLVGEQALSPLVQVRFPPTIRLGLDGSILFTR